MQAAWGEKQKQDTQLAIRSFEFGILFTADQIKVFLNFGILSIILIIKFDAISYARNCANAHCGAINLKAVASLCICIYVRLDRPVAFERLKIAIIIFFYKTRILETRGESNKVG